MTSTEIKAAIALKSEQLRSLQQLSPEWEAVCKEVRALRAMLPNPMEAIKPGVYFAGKGKNRVPFLVTA